jgi:AcrR family transcriptional regulator
MKLFAENGVENTSFEWIAREFGFSLRSVQNYYHTKNDLIAAVLDYELTLEMKEMKTCIASEQYQLKNRAEQIRDAFTRGLQDGSVTNQMESNLMDAGSITLALYGIKEQ